MDRNVGRYDFRYMQVGVAVSKSAVGEKRRFILRQ